VHVRSFFLFPTLPVRDASGRSKTSRLGHHTRILKLRTPLTVLFSCREQADRSNCRHVTTKSSAKPHHSRRLQTTRASEPPKPSSSPPLNNRSCALPRLPLEPVRPSCSYTILHRATVLGSSHQCATTGVPPPFTSMSWRCRTSVRAMPRPAELPRAAKHLARMVWAPHTSALLGYCAEPTRQGRGPCSFTSRPQCRVEYCAAGRH
jgi:hypothetical protein